MDEEILTGRAKQIQDYLDKKLAPFYTKKDPETGEEIPLDYSSPDAPLRTFGALATVADIPASKVRKSIYSKLTGEEKDEVSPTDVVTGLEKKIGAPIPEMPGSTLKMKDILGYGVIAPVTDPLMYTPFAAKAIPALAEGATSLGRSGVNLARTAAGMPRKGFVDEILPAVKGEVIERVTPEFKRINGLLPSPESAETIKVSPAVSTPEAPPVATPVAPKPAKPEKFQKIREILPGMYSKTESIIENKMGGSATPQQIIGMLREAKPEELEYLGIPQFLEGKTKISKEELLEHIRSNLPQITPLPVKGRITGEDSDIVKSIQTDIANLSSQYDQGINEIKPMRQDFTKMINDHPLDKENTMNNLSQWENLVREIIWRDEIDDPSVVLREYGINLSEENLNKFEKYLEKKKELDDILNRSSFAEQALSDAKDRIDPRLKPVHPTQTEPGGQNYEEHLFQYNPKNLEKRGSNLLTKEGVKIYDDYQKQIDNLKSTLDPVYEQVDEEVKKLEAPFNEKSKIIMQNLNEATKIVDAKNASFLEQVKASYPSNRARYADMEMRLVRELLNSNENIDNILELLKNFDRQNGNFTNFHETFLNTLAKDPEYVANRPKIKKAVDEISNLDEELYEIRKAKSKELIEPVLKKIDELESSQSLAISPHNRNTFTVAHHWHEPNVLGHIRTNERIGPEGETHLFAEELQSDWQQKIRDAKKKIEKAKQQPPYSSRHLEEDLSSLGKAPLEKAWPEFLSKRLLHEAATKDVDNISWTTGSQQSERYNFTKHLNRISYDLNTQRLLAYNKDDNQIVNRAVPPEKLEEYIGKDLAKKLLESPKTGIFSEEGSIHTLTGDDLKIENEGMKGFYDEIVPSIISKMGKRFGVKPQKTVLPEAGEVWTMKLTPEMKASILKEKFPLFTGAGAALTGGLMSNESEASENEENKSTRFSRLKSKIKKK